VVISNLKGYHHKLRVKDAETWENVEVTLRQIKNDSGSNRKNAYKIEIDAFYTSFNRPITLIVDKSFKAKDNKARLDTIRIT
jgi:uncharacterized lipoprotein YehR (DUF1307 family)